MNSIKLKPEINELYTLNEFILNELSQENLQVNLIVEEIFANIVNYSGTDYIIVEAEYEDSTLTLEFIDNGMEFNPLSMEDPEPSENIEEAQIGGLGIFFAKELSDGLEYYYENGENHLIIIKNGVS